MRGTNRDEKDQLGRSRGRDEGAGWNGEVVRCRTGWGDREVQDGIGRSRGTGRDEEIARCRTGWEDLS